MLHQTDTVNQESRLRNAKARFDFDGADTPLINLMGAPSYILVENELPQYDRRNYGIHAPKDFDRIPNGIDDIGIGMIDPYNIALPLGTVVGLIA